MAGSGKSVAILATLMFAMLLSGSMVNAARPIGVNGGENAAVQPNSRQLNFFFKHHFGCGWFFWSWRCAPRYYVKPVYQAPVPAPVEEEEDDKRRKLQSVADTDSTLSLPVNGGDATTALQSNGRQLNWFFKCWFWCRKPHHHHAHHHHDDYKYGRKLNFFIFYKFYKPRYYKPVKVYEPKYNEPKYDH